MADGYRIADEPRPGRLSHMAVSPVWPLFGVMFSGAVLGWGWFAFNSVALGCPYRRGAWKWIALGMLGTLGLYLGATMLLAGEVVTREGVPYIIIGLTVWKVLVSYKVFLLQSRTFEIYRHYGGVARNGVFGVLVLFLVGKQLLESLPPFLIPILR